MLAKNNILSTNDIVTFSIKEDEQHEMQKTNFQEKVDDLDDFLDQMCNDLNKSFYRLKHLKRSTIDDIRDITSQIQSYITDYNVIISDIVLHGSGNDCIYRHCINVALLSYILGKWIGLSEAKLNLLTYSAILHDIGKTKIEKDILNKNGYFSDDDYSIIKSHSLLGYNIIKEINFLDRSVSQGVLMHHERLDGSGYPFGIKEDKISQFARIIAIADTFDAVNSNRIYKKKQPPFQAILTIKEQSFGKLDYEYCDIFLHHILNYYNGNHVLLNNKMEATIIKMDINTLDRPLILLEGDFLELKESPDLYIESLIL